MIGAIIGDIAGSRFERVNRKSKNFRIFHEKSHPTDDSVMSLAVAKAILECNGDYSNLSARAVSCMQELGRMYKNAGYGGNFIQWIWSKDPKPYGSFGNGAAMRVSPCGFAAKSIDEAKQLSEMVTKVSHDHPEALKGAEAIAVCVFLARSGKTKDEIRNYVKENYYGIDFTIDGIRSLYKFDVSCQGSVPVALEAFFESTDFEDAIRNAVSVGGDSDTIAAMAGAVAEAYYGVPEDFVHDAMDYLDGFEAEILYYFEKIFPSKALAEKDEDEEDDGDNPDLTVFDAVDYCVDKVIPNGVDMYSGEEPPEPEGYTGTIIFNTDGMTKPDGSKVDGPVHVWVKESDMIPNFSSFEEGKHFRDDSQAKRPVDDKRKKNGDFFKEAQKAFNHLGSKASDSINSMARQVSPTMDKAAKQIQSQAKQAAHAIAKQAQKIQSSQKKQEQSQHTVVQLAGSSIKILLPDGYERVKFKNPVENVAGALGNTQVAYRKTIGNSDNATIISKISREKAMNPDDIQGLIDGIHSNLHDRQGLIEARNGITRWGYKYIYSIVKTLSEELGGGVRYFVLLNIFSHNDKDIVEVQADFTEIRTTGLRESACTVYAEEAGYVNLQDEEWQKTWFKDPYDPEYTKGLPKNLAEKEGLDVLFPYNPLSQAHEFLYAVLDDSFVKQTNPDGDESKNVSDANEADSKEQDQKESQADFLKRLFVDENMRITYPVDILSSQKSSLRQDNAIRCYSLRNYHLSNTEKTITAIETLKKAGYDSKIYVKDGEMLGYVFAKVGDLKNITELLKPCGVEINPKPVEHDFAEMIKKQA